MLYEEVVSELGEDRYRHEVADAEDRLQTITSYVWLRADQTTDEDDGCAVNPASAPAPWPWLGLAALLLLHARLGRKFHRDRRGQPFH